MFPSASRGIAGCVRLGSTVLRTGVACLLAGWLLSDGTARADIFTYVDSDGVLHFTNTPSKTDPWKLYARTKDAARASGGRAAGWGVSLGGDSAERQARFADVIREAAAYYQLPEAFVLAIMRVESNFEPSALSIAGAQGLMQLMPETAARMLVVDPWDPRENIFGGCRYLRILANAFDGDLELTVAAYNAGEGAVLRAGGIPAIAETQDYVVKVKAWYRLYRNAAQQLPASETP